jgi:epoxide hydrolase-like protein
MQLATIQELARYWATEYDWRRFEERFVALPHFITEIDGVDIHFIHVRSGHDDALPLIVTHGRPGSTIEQLKRACSASTRTCRRRFPRHLQGAPDRRPAACRSLR